jgi:hypothetical protein
MAVIVILFLLNSLLAPHEVQIKINEAVVKNV